MLSVRKFEADGLNGIIDFEAVDEPPIVDAATVDDCTIELISVFRVKKPLVQILILEESNLPRSAFEAVGNELQSLL